MALLPFWGVARNEKKGDLFITLLEGGKGGPLPIDGICEIGRKEKQNEANRFKVET